MDFYERVEYKTVNYIFKYLNELTPTYGSQNFFQFKRRKMQSETK